MKFHRNVPMEHRSLLKKDLKQYEKEVQMNKKELQELHRWVQEGHSPYDNGWYIATDYGTPMDYISAKRLMESGAFLESVYDTVGGDPILFIQDEREATTDEQLPF